MHLISPFIFLIRFLLLSAFLPAKSPGNYRIMSIRKMKFDIVDGLDAGVVLVASPTDYGHFTQKSVALLIEYSSDASKAVIIDRGSPFKIGEMTDLNLGPLSENRLYRGGEDGGSAVIMIHSRPDISGSQRIGDTNLYIGGLSSAIDAVNSNKAQANEFKFFFNFMRWAPGGLEEQIESGKWSTIFLDDETVLSQATHKDQETWSSISRKLQRLQNVQNDS